MNFDRGQTSRETLDRWIHRTVSRMGFRDPDRPPFERELFLKQYREDHPWDPRAEEFADAFQEAVAASYGNTERFKLELKRRLEALHVKWVLEKASSEGTAGGAQDP
jgi:hypothetical protein